MYRVRVATAHAVYRLAVLLVCRILRRAAFQTAVQFAKTSEVLIPVALVEAFKSSNSFYPPRAPQLVFKFQLEGWATFFECLLFSLFSLQDYSILFELPPLTLPFFHFDLVPVCADNYIYCTTIN